MLADIEDLAIIDLTPGVIRHAILSLEDNALGGMDAMHIGCALALQTEIFVSADMRRCDAAARAGLNVEKV